MKSTIVTVFVLLACLCFCASAQSQYTESLLRATLGDDPKTTGYFWAIADPHVDLLYKQDTNPNCDIPQCCRVAEPNATNNAGKFGAFGRCDAPLITFQNTLEFIKSYPVTPDFIAYIGDNVPHDDWSQSREINLHGASVIHEALRTTFPSTLVLSTLGNHDAFPVDQLDTPPNGAWFLLPMADMLSSWLPEESLKTYRQAGYYSIQVRPGLRVLTLNSLYVDPINFYLYRNLTDPARQLEWLSGELASAKMNGEKVFILGHIPPGIVLHKISPSAIISHSVGLEKLVDQYRNTIVAQFYGHVHHDFFKLFFDTRNRSIPTGVLYSMPSVTCYSSTHPAVRLFKYNLTTFEILDSLTFIMNLTSANMRGEMIWEFEYSAKEQYKLPDLSAKSWYNVWKEMHNTKSVAWQSFARYYHTLRAHACGSPANEECVRYTLCSMGNMNYDSYKLCITGHNK